MKRYRLKGMWIHRTEREPSQPGEYLVLLQDRGETLGRWDGNEWHICSDHTKVFAWLEPKQFVIIMGQGYNAEKGAKMKHEISSAEWYPVLVPKFVAQFDPQDSGYGDEEEFTEEEVYIIKNAFILFQSAQDILKEKKS